MAISALLLLISKASIGLNDGIYLSARDTNAALTCNPRLIEHCGETMKNDFRTQKFGDAYITSGFIKLAILNASSH